MNFSLSMELQRAWRRLVRAPAFSISVIVLMALGIGGMTAVATAGWSLFLRPLPYQQAEQLVNITVWQKRAGYHMGLSAALVEELNREQSFGTIGIVERPFQLRLAGGTGVRAGRIDHRLLPVLRISPLAGRVLNENDVIPGADPVALISRRFWLEHFGGEASAIGRMLELEYGQVRIAGVLPDRFALPEATTDIWLPMDLGPELLSPTNYSTLWSHTVVARMPEAQERGQYRARVLARLGETELLSSRAYPDRIEMQVRPLRTVWSGGQGNGLLILGVATAVVLIATWLNLAGLWLARWTGRTHELAIQFALGARSGAATTGIVLEYLALGIPGLLLAVGVAGLGIEMLYSLGVLNESGPLRVGSSLPSLVIGGALLATGLVPLLFFLFALPGYVYGKITGSIEKPDDVLRFMEKGMKDLAGYIVLMLVIAQFINLFSWSRLDAILAINGAEFLQSTGLTGPLMFILFMILVAIINIFMGSGSAKWAIFAPIFIPMLAQLDYSPAFIQLMYRVGDSITNCISPLYVYFPLLMGWVRHHDRSMGIGTILSLLVPYAVLLFVLWTVLVFVWFWLELPIGVGEGIFLGS